MKIEFRKIPLDESEFEISSNSVKFLGTFSKISSKLAKINSKLVGKCDVDCCKCGTTFTIPINTEVKFVVSDGIYSSEQDEEEFVIIEVEEHLLDFDEILHSEIESLKSEYHICDTCKNNDELVEIEY
ncbi:hypothetical protein ALC152_11810 [Arcobacter sp. 15-2]|uniref:hypothetical protein n=1 Tax=Arcobacter sp. 15-2 TaxID=3374109 RepID=UPI00399D1AD0